jgi:hypothetical protein
MKSKKKVALIASAIVVVVVVIAVVSINLVNKSVEKQLVIKLDNQIKNSDYADNLTYKDLKVKAQNGSFIVKDIKFIDENFMVTIDSAAVKMPIKEAISLAKDSTNTMLTDISIEMSGIEALDQAETVSYGQENLTVKFKGHINTRLFDSQYTPENIDADLGVKQISLNVKDIKYISPIGKMDLQNFAFNVDADLRPSVFGGNSFNKKYSMLQSLDMVSFNLENYSFEAAQNVSDSLSMLSYMYLGEDAFVKNQENWKIMKCSSNIDVTDNQIVVNNLDLVTNWINMNTEASVSIEPEFKTFTPLNMNINLKEYSSELRPLFEGFIGNLTEDKIPEGSFSLNLVQSDEGSFPKISIK